MKYFVLYLMSLLSFVSVRAQELKPFEIYNHNGKKVSYKKMLKDLSKQEVVLFGELHDNSIVHWIQLRLMKDLAQNRPLTFGLEMFERDQQSVINEYLKGAISESQFDTLTRFWNNYKTDYRPMVEWAKAHNIPVVATNVPRTYAKIIHKQGEDALMELNNEEKQFIAPLPIPYDANLPAYQKMMEMFKDSPHANPNFPKAQALKDATMAYSIVQNYQANKLFYHINGAFHSDHHEAIVWYLQQYQPSLKIKTISVVETDQVHNFQKEHRTQADYIIYVSSDMIKTY